MKPAYLREPVYIREQERYAQSALCTIMNVSNSEIVPIIRRLKEFGILKAVKATEPEKEMSELLDEEVEISEVVAGDVDHYYVFTFVGVISVEGHILICYPKYLSSNLKPHREMRQVIKVLDRYNNSKEQIIHLFNDSSEGKTFNLLALLLFLLKDYHEYGSYTNTQEILESNGAGEIIWDRTISEASTFINNNRPYYMEFYTKKRVTDDYDYFKRLHECIITQASNELKSAKILELFDLTGAEISDEIIADFGDDNYILYRIQNELSTQFNTRKQMILTALYAFIDQKNHLLSDDSFSMIGTNKFNLVWEDVCKEILADKLHVRLNNLGITLDPKYLTKEYKYGDLELIDIIDKPIWSITEREANDTLIPDLITLDEKRFIIFDAKYYNPELIRGKTPKGQPGVESVIKQYLYQMAYQEFIQANKFESVINCFVIPTADPQADIFQGHVSIGFLKKYTGESESGQKRGLENIQVRLLPTEDAFEHYLNGKKYPLSALKLDLPVPSVRTIK